MSTEIIESDRGNQPGLGVGNAISERTSKSTVPTQPELSAIGFVDRVQIHGLVDCYRATSFSTRFFWLLILSACFTVASFNIWKSVDHFINQEIQTTVTNLKMNKMFFPPLYICPSKYIDYKKAAKLGLEETVMFYSYAQFFHGFLFHRLLTLNLEKHNSWAEALYYRWKIPTMNFTLSTFRDTLLSVSFNASELFKGYNFLFSNVDPAKQNRFNFMDNVKPVINAYYGVCYQIRLGPDVYQDNPYGGLTLLIDLHAHDYTSLLDAKAMLTGVTLKFGKYADPITPGGGYLAGPGRLVQYSLHKQINRLMSTKEHPCIDIKDAPQLTFLNASYNPSYCGYECYMRFLCPVQVPPCLFVAIEPSFMKQEFLDTPMCNIGTVANCVNDTAWKRTVQKCGYDCTELCQTEDLEVHESSMELGSPHLRAVGDLLKLHSNLSHLDDPDYWKASLLMVHVTFAEMSETVIEQSKPITAVQLISDVGGQWGLWLGASIFTVCQIVVLLLSWCHTKLKTLKQKLNQKIGSKE